MVDIIITTTGTREYASAILQTLDPQHVFFKKLYAREDQKMSLEVADTYNSAVDE